VLLAGGPFTVTAEVDNWTNRTANGVQIELLMGANLQLNRLVTSTGEVSCQQAGVSVTCPLGALPPSSNLPLTMTLSALRANSYPAVQRFDLRVTLQEVDFQPANNRAFRDVEIVPSLEYTNDFTLGSDSHWSPTQTHQTSSGLIYLGMFDTDPAVFNWGNLPPHDQALLCFDLFILGGWDGSATQEPTIQSPASNFIGPDLWYLYLDEQRLMINSFSNRPALEQSFPDPYNDGSHPAQQDAAETGDFDDAPQVTDARYHLCRTLPHNAADLTASFNGFNLNERLDEKWALDNVLVRVFYKAAFDWLYLPLVIR
jgi:hypothetical protein